jgi:hypothetical protein
MRGNLNINGNPCQIREHHRPHIIVCLDYLSRPRLILSIIEYSHPCPVINSRTQFHSQLLRIETHSACRSQLIDNFVDALYELEFVVVLVDLV